MSAASSFAWAALLENAVPAFICFSLSSERQILIDQRIVTAAVEKQEAITRDDRRAPGRLPLHSSYRIAYSKSFPDVTLTASLPL